MENVAGDPFLAQCQGFRIIQCDGNPVTAAFIILFILTQEYVEGFLEREEGRERERQSEGDMDWLPAIPVPNRNVP